jgi:hypothetical protein
VKAGRHPPVGNPYVYYLFMGTDDNRPNRTISPPFDLTILTFHLLLVNAKWVHEQPL